eukprot:CAMPEP_0117677236 /NCGR_PEP_ID=MMETSP0804-20121206/16637_1 /TAXON_ID=1074897 /ORGANISM="Tetraselmis astigmatica, Strain CCMP880" /LENGTH=256 /DNA_ID=CAMNT_0005486505 /DNA_START=354 /DNA_END=1123 /DNA_ORIENTATION=+
MAPQPYSCYTVSSLPCAPLQPPYLLFLSLFASQLGPSSSARSMESQTSSPALYLFAPMPPPLFLSSTPSHPLFSCSSVSAKIFNAGDSAFIQVLNLEDGTVKTSVLSKCYVEFPQIDQRLCGRRSRFAYCAEMDEECVRTGSLDKVAFGSLAKIDMHKEGIEAGPQGDALAGRIPLGPGRSCGEPIFVPREAAKSEDDGYLLTYVYDEAAKTSDLLVFDALSMDPKPLAKALLPQRVPNGFHALFVSEKQLQQQRR